MARLGLGQKPVVMLHYPHMLSEDIEVWSAYLKNPLVPILEVWYDLHVGAGIAVADRSDTLGISIAQAVGRKRIDAVCRVGGGFWVVEIKPFGSMLALGQAISYWGLFLREYDVAGEVWPVVVCTHADPDLIFDFDSGGVGIIETG